MLRWRETASSPMICPVHSKSHSLHLLRNLRRTHERAREDFWQRLPGMSGLPSWKELDIEGNWCRLTALFFSPVDSGRFFRTQCCLGCIYLGYSDNIELNIRATEAQLSIFQLRHRVEIRGAEQTLYISRMVSIWTSSPSLARSSNTRENLQCHQQNPEDHHPNCPRSMEHALGAPTARVATRSWGWRRNSRRGWPGRTRRIRR